MDAKEKDRRKKKKLREGRLLCDSHTELSSVGQGGAVGPPDPMSAEH